MSERIVLSIDRCSKHRDFYAICIQQGNSGRRLTPSKCCGQWSPIKQWTLTPDEAREIANTFLSVAGEVPADDDGDDPFEGESKGMWW